MRARRAVFRKDPRAEQRFPSLYAAGRAGRPRKAARNDAEVEGGGVAGGAGAGVADGGVEATPA